WAVCASKLSEHQGATAEVCDREIDTLLVFAGLFSAVVSTFGAQTYSSLQPSVPDASTQLLAQVSAQLASISIALHPPSLNSSGSMCPLGGSGTPWSAILINMSFFSSLILSLAVATKGILLKQWLSHFRKIHGSDPRQCARIWHLRQQGWERFQASEMLADLPWLMQEAVLLFLAGLTGLLWTLNTFVALCGMVFIGPTIVTIIWTTLVPVKDHQCPFKSPQSWMTYNI
ncbi:hypothetical protein OBBRIDRAFT_698329, partial [Obba rivulosa]